MSHRSILLQTDGAVTLLALGIGLRALTILARSGKAGSRPTPQVRLSLWSQAAVSLAAVLTVVPPAITSNWNWRIGCLLAGAALLLAQALAFLRMRSADRDK